MEDAGPRKVQRGALLISNLPALQNLVRRDPDGYVAEFATQWDHYDALRRVIELGVGAGHDATAAGSVAGTGGGGTSRGRRETEEQFRDAIGFLCRTAPLYGNKKTPVRPVLRLPAQLADLLQRPEQVSPETRKAIVTSLIGMRRLTPAGQGLLTDTELLKVLFPLLSTTTSPSLRTTVLTTILTTLKRANKKAKAHTLNRTVQTLLSNLVDRGMDPLGSSISGTGARGGANGVDKTAAQNAGREAMWAVKLTSELWRKGIWNDGNTVRIISQACFHPHTKVQSSACHFFLAEDNQSTSKGLDGADSNDDDGSDIDVRQVKHVQSINKKRSSSDRKAKSLIRSARKKSKAKANAAPSGNANSSAINLLQDPQSFGDRLFQSLQKFDKKYTLDHKVLLMRLLSRCTSVHELQPLGFYSYILKYLNPSQLSVTAILAALAGSVHALTPPDALSPCLRKLAHDFVHPGVAVEVISAGLNSIREICKRQPLGMELDLLEDLVSYRKSKDKGVMIAARGLLSLYREVAPEMLKKRERGKAATMAQIKSGGPGEVQNRYGFKRDEAVGIAGLDLLEADLAQQQHEGDGEDRGWEGWEEDEDEDSSSDDSAGWIDVSSDEGNGNVNISSSSSSSSSEDEDSSDEEKEVKDDNEGSSSKKRTKKKKATRREKREREWKRRRTHVHESEPVVDESTGLQMSTDAKPNIDPEEESGSESDNEQEVEEAAAAAAAVVVATDDLSNSLAATKILTPADFARLNELRVKALEDSTTLGTTASTSSIRKTLANLKASLDQTTTTTNTATLPLDSDRFVTETDIVGDVRCKTKANYEDRMASVAAGREGRDKFGSAKMRGRKTLKNGAPGSSTNEAKSRQKAFAMTQQSQRVRSKKGASLRDRQKVLRAHVDRKKRGGRRGNG